MGDDERKWISDAQALCQDATRAGVLIMIRDEDAACLVTNATTPALVNALGRAWAGGYGYEDENDREETED